MPVFLAFLVFPLLELALLIYIGSQTSIFLVMSVVILTAILGGLIMRQFGLGSLVSLRSPGRDGSSPGGAIMDATLLSLSGFLLFLPGIICDFIGIALLFPPTRRFVRNRMNSWLTQHVNVRVQAFRSGPTGSIHYDSWDQETASDEVLNAEIVRRSPTDGSQQLPKGSIE